MNEQLISPDRRPIILYPHEVIGVLAGHKHQLRRVVKPPPPFDLDDDIEIELVTGSIRCPYQPGDKRWVLENGWQPCEPSLRQLRDGADTWPKYVYDADGISENDTDDYKRWGWKRRPSIHMPRWASRLTLDVVSVRAQRLQEMSQMDAVAEGVGFTNPAAAMREFRDIWDSINAKRGHSWASNPWFWVVGFRRVQP